MKESNHSDACPRIDDIAGHHMLKLASKNGLLVSSHSHMEGVLKIFIWLPPNIQKKESHQL